MMTRRHQPTVHPIVRTIRSIARRLRPSPTSFAAAAAAHDPGLLLAVEAARRRRADNPPARRGRRQQRGPGPELGSAGQV
jgi:hypothetical protein